MTPTVLVLTGGPDPGARAVAEVLAPRAEVVTALDLALARRWVHRVDPTGATVTEVVTRTGVRLRDRDVGAVLNRLTHLPPARFLAAGTPERDRDYAGAELQALLVGWLGGLSRRVLNPVTGLGPFTGVSPRAWLTLAARTGLPTIAWSTAVPNVSAAVPAVPADGPDPPGDPAGDVTVVGDRVVGTLAGSFGAACRRVARAAGCPLLRFGFVSIGGRTLLAEVDPLPPLESPGTAEAVAAYLTRVAES